MVKIVEKVRVEDIQEQEAWRLWKSFLRAVELRDWTLIEYTYAQIVIHRYNRYNFPSDPELDTIS